MKDKDQLAMLRERYILLVDDHDATRETLTEVIRELGHHVVEAANFEEAVARIEERAHDLVLTDLKLPDGSGMDVMKRLKKLHPETPVVMITGHATIENAIDATRLGAYEYLTKPVDLKRLRIVISNALYLSNLERQVRQTGALDALVGHSPKIRQVKDLIKQVAGADVTILVVGESGTGKEMAANAIQALSSRKDGPFVKVNVAVLSRELIESELFGHEKGAFSGAVRQRKGRFELADGGTLFLDEIGEMPLDSQVKLLRVLQEHEFERVGGAETLPVNIRLICATNLDLKERVDEGKFREDLYFRINVVRLKMPPLRERVGDIALLAEHFRQKYCARYNLDRQFDPETLAVFERYSWPGNVRELENAVEGAVVRSTGRMIDAACLPEELGDAPRRIESGVEPGVQLAEIERRYILSELSRLGGNKSAVAKSLGIGLKTLYRKLETYSESPITPDPDAEYSRLA
ncbi:MAG: sigma-54 dependent transcriptional regulator [Planctomycetota bacterium]|jgi:DNA-binding NtrC family response regulator|nr:sigma-54 dependent transcriptional regulator [Planctomycetota bacterium]